MPQQLLKMLLIVSVFVFSPSLRAAEPLTIATFQADVTPPIGSPLCDGLVKPAATIVDPLSARGVVLFGEGKPIVLCAVDWVGIGNGGHDAWRAALADAAGTSVDRVVVHTLHQHDAPGCDFTADEILAPHGLSGELFHVVFARQAMTRTYWWLAINFHTRILLIRSTSLQQLPPWVTRLSRF